jgi:hypothetical protein
MRDKNHFIISQIGPQKNKVTVEDDAFGLVFEVYSPNGEWETVEIYNNYFVRFTYADKPDAIIQFME